MVVDYSSKNNVLTVHSDLYEVMGTIALWRAGTSQLQYRAHGSTHWKEEFVSAAKLHPPGPKPYASSFELRRLTGNTIAIADIDLV